MGAIFFLEKSRCSKKAKIYQVPVNSRNNRPKVKTKITSILLIFAASLFQICYPTPPPPPPPPTPPYKANDCFPRFIVFGFLPWRVNQGNNFNFLCSGINFGDPSLLPLVFIYYLFVPLRKIEKKKSEICNCNWSLLGKDKLGFALEKRSTQETTMMINVQNSSQFNFSA